MRGLGPYLLVCLLFFRAPANAQETEVGESHDEMSTAEKLEPGLSPMQCSLDPLSEKQLKNPAEVLQMILDPHCGCTKVLSLLDDTRSPLDFVRGVHDGSMETCLSDQKGAIQKEEDCGAKKELEQVLDTSRLLYDVLEAKFRTVEHVDTPEAWMARAYLIDAIDTLIESDIGRGPVTVQSRSPASLSEDLKAKSQQLSTRFGDKGVCKKAKSSPKTRVTQSSEGSEIALAKESLKRKLDSVKTVPVSSDSKAAPQLVYRGPKYLFGRDLNDYKNSEDWFKSALSTYGEKVAR